jgi:hypothetical protein
LEKLILRAKVLEAEIDKSNEKYPRCQLKLEVTFINKGNEPIIILQPIKEREKLKEFGRMGDFIFSGGISIYGNQRHGYYWIDVGAALPSTCIGCNEDLAKLLDKKSPPQEYTKTLKPNEFLTFTENESFAMSMKNNNGRYGWEEMSYNGWKIAGDITYSMFPINLGKYGSDFGQKLQTRWKKYGILYVGETHSLITSEKFEIDLSSLKFE